MKKQRKDTVRKGASRIHLVIDDDILKRIRHYASVDRQTLSAKIVTLLEKAMRAA